MSWWSRGAEGGRIVDPELRVLPWRWLCLDERGDATEALEAEADAVTDAEAPVEGRKDPSRGEGGSAPSESVCEWEARLDAAREEAREVCGSGKGGTGWPAVPTTAAAAVAAAAAAAAAADGGGGSRGGCGP